jgi:hypothetical protein
MREDDGVVVAPLDEELEALGLGEDAGRHFAQGFA